MVGALLLGGIGHARPVAVRAEEAGAEADFFERRVRPVLIQHCLKCHGQGPKIQGGLRLDSRPGWVEGGDSGPAIVPGQPDASLLIRAVRHDPDVSPMPPTGRLPDPIVRDLEDWIRQGAADPRVEPPNQREKADSPARSSAREHWAYQPPRAATPPEVNESDWPRGDIDRFILARLEREGLKPAPDADRTTLTRRLYFDLVGLPPAPEELDASAADNSPNAMERLVDRLLDSPHFGERWGRHWLDVVRFGESFTLRGLILPEAWRFRDYVIDAFNADRPFDQILREHVAGDLMAADSVEERQRQSVASSFLAFGNWNLEEQDKQQLRMDVVDEQLDTIGKAFLAQTFGCARCHDHKFDPISTREYYGLAGILRNTLTLEDANVSKWLERPFPVDSATEAQLALHEAKLAELDLQIAECKQTIAKLAESKGNTDVLAVDRLAGIVVDDAAARPVGNWTASRHVRRYIGAGYVHDGNEGKGQKTLTFQPEFIQPGRYQVRLAYTPGSNRATNVPVTVFSAEGEATVQINQRRSPPMNDRWIDLGTYRFELNGQGFVIVANDQTDGHVVADAIQFLPVDSATNLVVDSNTSPVDQAGTAALTEEKTAKARLQSLERQRKDIVKDGPRRPLYLAVVEGSEIGEAFVCVRGNVHQRGETVARGFPEAMSFPDPPAIPSDQSGRLQLAQWLTHPENPLAARVIVNRVWHWLFGAGLVRTTDNFGIMGEAPSHPELLDHLALEFMKDGWSIKRLVRRLALSRTYQQSSQSNSAVSERDPDNRLWGRANRRRLDAESLRDAMLQVSGEIDLTMGGPTIKPGTTSDFDYLHQDCRRSVYSPVFRNALPEIFEVFDFADPSTVTGCRTTSTVAPQALFLLHSPFVQERARHAAARLLEDAERTDSQRIALAFRHAYSRPPTPREKELAQEFLDRSRQDAGGGAEIETWTELVRALFASADFRYVD